MKTFIGIIVMVALALASGQSFAAQGGEGSNTGCNGQGNASSPCAGGAGGAGGKGGTGIGVGIGGSASAGASNNVKLEDQRQAPAVFSPGLVAAPETCMGSVSAGASSPFGGVSFGSTYKNEDCELRQFAKALITIDPKYADVALTLLAQNAKVRQAFHDNGYQIPGDGKRAAAVKSDPLIATAKSTGVAASEDPTKLRCKDDAPPVRAANGEYFCSTR